MTQKLTGLNDATATELKESKIGLWLTCEVLIYRPFVDWGHAERVLKPSAKGLAQLKAHFRLPDEVIRSGRIDLNSASLADFLACRGIGQRLALELDSRRPFKHWQDVFGTPGIGPARLDCLKRRFSLPSEANTGYVPPAVPSAGQTNPAYAQAQGYPLTSRV